MAMKACKECGNEISSSAKICPKCGKKQKHTGILVFATIIVIFLGIGVASSINENALPSSSQSYKDEKITLEKFNKIETGMTYQEVVDIIGEEGTVLSEVDIVQDEQYHTIMYSWTAKDGIANANVTFQAGKVVSKAQIGLE